MRVPRKQVTGVAAVAVVLAAALAGSATAASPRVVGGSTVANPGWVAYVDIEYGDGSSGLCGGELIAKSWVLTAAHCVVDDKTGVTVGPAAVKTWVGLDRMSEGTSANADGVDRVVVDPAFSSATSEGDIAALHLAAQDAHDPVALGPAADPAAPSTAEVLGYGVTNSVVNQPSDSLQEVATPILDPSQCGGYGAMFDPSTMVCAGGVRGQDSCNGDSGGPLAYAPGGGTAELVGTVDYGSDVCGDGSPAVYQRVTGGADAQFLASTVPVVSITPSSASPAKDSTITATAAASGLSSPSYTWDLNGDGQFGDATGPAVSVPIGGGPVSIAARAIGADGDEAAQRATVTPVDTSVAVTAPKQVREGTPLVLTLATTGPATGTLTARATGRGISTSATAPLPQATRLDLTFPNDHTWHPPRVVDVSLTATDPIALSTPARFSVTLLDDDKPVLKVSSAHRVSRRRVSAKVVSPGAGTTVVRLVRGNVVFARRTLRVSATAPKRSLSLTLSAAAAARLGSRRPTLRASWRSAAAPTVDARASVRVR